MNRVCVFFAQGFEEIEGLTVVDLMRRAGIPITMVAVGDSLEPAPIIFTLRQTAFSRTRIFRTQKCLFYRAERREPAI